MASYEHELRIELPDGRTEVIMGKLAIVVPDGWSSDDFHLACENDNSRLSQEYVCPKCDNKYKKGEIKKRVYQKGRKGIVIPFYQEQYEKFVETKLSPRTIIKEKPIPVSEVYANFEFLMGKKYEFFNNESEEYRAKILKLWQVLAFGKLALKGRAKLGDKMVGVYVLAGNGRLVIQPLTNAVDVKESNQIGLSCVPIPQGMYNLTHDESRERKEEFIKLIQEGKAIEAEPVKEEVPETHAEFIWEKELTELQTSATDLQKKMLKVPAQ